ncbi:claspin isoform X2 [Prionailurus bengalensis]|uniref:claspin isoform X2 n=1 Tax=Prionailurus bengalensis TaxID=37029 RepID=UPI001CA9576C|nr:claspin isoform X2 [Prionailurus bengalensis]
MTGEVLSEVHLEISDPKLISQEEPDSPSDSGQGSCGTIVPLSDGDSDEEIFVSKKLKSRKLLQDSDSEREDTNAFPEKTYDSVEEENKENLYARKNGKVRRIYKTLADSAGSDIEESLYQENLETQVTPCLELSLQSENSVDFTVDRKISKKPTHDKERMEGKAKVKSKRRLEKEEKKMEKIRRLKKKETKNEEDDVKQPFNDSGCLLVDKDLFETGLEEENNSALEDEESLESIRAAVKNKVRKHKKKELSLESGVYSFEEETELSKGTIRKERKAAKLSKEALKKLHSETQRLIRESALNLPYHMPENKTIHDFFKRKPRPTCQGNAMALLKSSKYQSNHHKETIDTVNTSEMNNGHHNKDSEQTVCVGHELEINALPAVSKEPQITTGSGESCSKDMMGSEELEIQEKQKQGDGRPPPEDSSVAHQESNFLGNEDNEVCQAGGLMAPEPRALEGEEGLKRTEEADEKVEEPRQQTKSVVVPLEKARRFTLDRLKQLGVDVSIKPRLGADEDSFVILEEPETNRELEALKQRFWKHANPAVKPRAGQKMNVNIIVKGVGTDGKEELKADVVPVTLAAEKLDGASHTKPGEKLQVLKAKLQEAMKLRRLEERRKRQALFKLDNEDGFEEEEEEEEMTDESEEDGEEEEEGDLEEEEEEEEGNQEVAEFLLSSEEIETKDEKEMDKENSDGSSEIGKSVGLLSVPKPLSSDSTLLLFKDNSSKMGYFPSEEKSETDEISGKRPSKLDEDDSCSLLTKESSHNSSFELIGSTIPSYQPCNRQTGRGTSFLPTAGGFRSPSPGLFRASLVSSASKSSGKLSEPSLPIEDSQDLYNASPEPKTLFLGAGDFQFCLEDDTQSQLLDADGFLNVRNHRNQYQSLKPRLPLASMDENAMDANMDELLDLCTGKFTSQAEKTLSRKSDKKENLEELLNLCSGKFTSQDASTLAPSELNKQEKENSLGDPMEEALALCSGSFPTDREEEEGEEEEFGDFRLVPNDNEFDSDEDERSNSDNEHLALEDHEDDDEELLKQSEKFKRQMRLKKYLEDEAEVSGSDVGSEDEYDGEDIDEYEQEEIDEVLPSDEELQNQIKKIHMKTMLDDDKRQLRLYQERYLADGDLHSDGPGRMRKFRWKNIDDASQMDLFHRDSDDDQIEEQLDETEAHWRKERIEREQWLRDQAQQGKIAAEEEEIGEDSQFMMLAKKVTAKALQKNASRTVVIQEPKSLLRNPFEAIRPESAHQLKTGSLLNQPKAVLQKLAALSDLNPSAPRNLRNFVFHTLSPVKAEAAKESSKPQVRRRGPSLMTSPSPKRLKTDDSTSGLKQSIFRYLES